MSTQPASEWWCTKTTIAAIETMNVGETWTPFGKYTRAVGAEDDDQRKTR